MNAAVKAPGAPLRATRPERWHQTRPRQVVNRPEIGQVMTWQLSAKTAAESAHLS